MQRHAKLLHGHLLGANPWLPSQHQARAGFASKTKDASKSEDQPPLDKGSRFAARLSPEQLERMKTILGVNDLGGEAQAQHGWGQPVKSVTINMLQTMKYLNTPAEMKQRLMAYKVMSLNRQLEELHVGSLRLMTSLNQQAQPPAAQQASGGLGLLEQMSRAAPVEP